MPKSKLSRISKDAKIGKKVRICDFVNIYGKCSIGDESVIGAFVGHGVMFINNKYPASVKNDGTPIVAKDTHVIPTLIKKGAGSVVTKDVPARIIACGVPARVTRKIA